MSHQDRVLTRTFFSILAVSLVSVFAQAFAGTDAGSAPKSMAEQVIAEDIKPVGQVDVAGASAPAPAQTAAASGGRTGKEIVQGTCSGCHATGVAGAPKIGSKSDWGPRYKQGMDVLLKTAIHGKGAMPPRGGGNFTDAEMKAAIEYMLKETGLH